jgi:hypothetical protein
MMVNATTHAVVGQEALAGRAVIGAAAEAASGRARVAMVSGRGYAAAREVIDGAVRLRA